MSDKVLAVKTIVKFLKNELGSTTHDEDCLESLDVAVQCIESAFNINDRALQDEIDTVPALVDLINISRRPSSPTTMRQADEYKNKGNALMQEDKALEALEQYNRAIELNNKNAVYFCNRAAAYSKLEKHATAIEDCKRAIALDISYSKAYGRMGLALSSLKKHAEARDAYKRALELEPDNKSYKNNLLITEEALRQENHTSSPTGPSTSTPIDFSLPQRHEELDQFPFNQILANPDVVNLATQILGNPHIYDLIDNMFDNTNLSEGTPDLSAFVNAGQQLAEQMQSTNPELVEQIRRTIQPNPPNDQPAGGPRDPPAPPQPPSGGSDM